MTDPISYEATPGFVNLLDVTGCTLVVTVYSQGRVVLVSAEADALQLQSVAFPRPMGVAVRRDGEAVVAAIAGSREVVTFRDEPLLAPGLPGAEGEFAHLLTPRSILFTGDIDAHDMVWIGDRLFAANTRFSCIAEINAAHSFVPSWQPPFISELTPDDRCHLNGIAHSDGKIVYATAFGATDTSRGWSEARANGGVLLEAPSGELILEGLSMPHSPRVFGEELYVLESGKGLVLKVDRRGRGAAILAKLPGFTRGMDLYGDILFVGLSRIRESARVPLPLQSEGAELVCGVAALDRKQGRLLGWLKFDQTYAEVFDVKVLTQFRRGALLSPLDDGHQQTISPPGRGFWVHDEPAPATLSRRGS